MTTQGPGRDGTPDEPDDTPSVPEEVWLKFLADSEGSIRASAPKEPSAQERASGRRPGPVDPRGTQRWARRPSNEVANDETAAVGDLWQPQDPWAGPAWRDLDDRARLRRVGRVIVTAAAIALALGTWSLLSTVAGTPSNAPSDTTVQRVEEAPDELPTAASLSPGSVSATPSSSAVHTG